MEKQAEAPARREKTVFAKKPLWDEQLVPLVLDAARDAWRQVQLLTVRVHLKAGFADPAQTGRMFGYMSALRGALYPVHAVDLSMEPLFDRVATEWDAALGLRIRHPSLLLPSGLRIAWRIARS
jgi:hypothetical protein